MLEGIPFGPFYYQVGVILRNSLLVSSLLSNSEAWYNITKAEIELLESVEKFIKSTKINAKGITIFRTWLYPIKRINYKTKNLISPLYYE